jgi:hypothetical protein
VWLLDPEVLRLTRLSPARLVAFGDFGGSGTSGTPGIPQSRMTRLSLNIKLTGIPRHRISVQRSVAGFTLPSAVKA